MSTADSSIGATASQSARPTSVPRSAATAPTLQGRVDLADVERPDLARPRLELALQPKAVLRPLAEEGQEGVCDTYTEYHTQYV
jgi:hypothetical protein